ncbi:aldehyde dehydrogenase family protein [Dasania marina]|uniref:aldehyde dehydrogenase family protein n=1 Tax=Dasania marina TaxID=471499 RepID=UPI00035DEF73|nr:aldehyde dehydrogenase family protein [Dasania marina]
MKKFNMTINGQQIISDSYFDVINPATEQVFAQCAKGSADDVDRAVDAASEAFKSWSVMADADRKAALHAVASLLETNMPELMELIVQETGKPMLGLNQVGAGMEVGGAAAWAHVNADIDLPVEVIQDNEDARIELHRKPLGVVASITPWNWPLLIAIWHIIPAMRAGNTVVLKPSPLTPVTTARFVELANTVLPPGVLNLVSGDGDVGAAMTAHEGIAKVVFTGSTDTGKQIMKAASGNLKRLTLELGGNDAGIVLDDVDPIAIAPKLIGACFHNNGQTCAALKRLYVHESMYESVCSEMARLASGLVVGNGLAEGTELGPVQNQMQLEIVESLAESARTEGGRFLCGGKRREGKGYFYEPTIVADLVDGNRLVDEEPFGPIVPVIKYSDIDEVIKQANSSPNGLGGSVWSTDTARAVEIGKRLETGTVWINDHGAVQPDMPFGGVKQSGFGVEFGLHGLQEFTSIQSVKIAK